MISDELARASYKGDNSQCPSPHLGMDYTALVDVVFLGVLGGFTVCVSCDYSDKYVYIYTATQ